MELEIVAQTSVSSVLEQQQRGAAATLSKQMNVTCKVWNAEKNPVPTAAVL